MVLKILLAIITLAFQHALDAFVKSIIDQIFAMIEPMVNFIREPI